MDRKYYFWNIIGRSFSFWFKNFGVFIKAAFVPVLLQVLGLFAALYPMHYLTSVKKLAGEALIPYLIPILICLIFGIVLYCVGFWKYLLLNCYFCYGANDYDEDRGFYLEIYKKDILNRQGGFVKALLWPALYGLLIFGGGTVLMLLCIKPKVPVLMLLAIFFVLATTVALIIYSLKVSFVIPIFTLEKDLKPRDVLSKSLDMIKGRPLLVVFGLSVAVGVVTFVLQALLGFIAGFGAGIFLPKETALQFARIVSNLASLVIIPFCVCIVTLAYKRFKE